MGKRGGFLAIDYGEFGRLCNKSILRVSPICCGELFQWVTFATHEFSYKSHAPSVGWNTERIFTPAVAEPHSEMNCNNITSALRTKKRIFIAGAVCSLCLALPLPLPGSLKHGGSWCKPQCLLLHSTQLQFGHKYFLIAGRKGVLAGFVRGV